MLPKDHLTRILIYGSNVYNGCYPKTILLVFLYMVAMFIMDVTQLVFLYMAAMFIMDVTRILIYGSNVYNGCYPKTILLVFLYMAAMFIMDVTQRPSYSYSYIWQQCL